MKRALTASAALIVLGAVPLVAGAAPPNKHLSISTSPNPVVFGRSVTVSGKLTGNQHDNKTVVLQADPYPYEGSFSNVGSDTTDANGDYSITTTPSRNTHYRTRQGNIVSSIVTELVRLRVSIHLSDSTPTRGQRVRFFGRACPQEDGALVGIQRFNHTLKRWVTIRLTHLLDIPGSTCSKYSRRVRIFRDGTFRTKVRSSDPAYANGFSRKRHIDAHS